LVNATDYDISLLPAGPYFLSNIPRWRAMTGVGTTKLFLANIVVVHNAKIVLYTKPYIQLWSTIGDNNFYH